MSKDTSSSGHSSPTPASGKRAKPGCSFLGSNTSGADHNASAQGSKAGAENLKKTQEKLTAGKTSRRGNEGVTTDPKVF